MEKIDWKKRAESLAKDNIKIITDNVSLKIKNKELKDRFSLSVVLQANTEKFCKEGTCKPMVNADWTYLICHCGKRFYPDKTWQ